MHQTPGWSYYRIGAADVVIVTRRGVTIVECMTMEEWGVEWGAEEGRPTWSSIPDENPGTGGRIIAD
jgi:hypothetical protein